MFSFPFGPVSALQSLCSVLLDFQITGPLNQYGTYIICRKAYLINQICTVHIDIFINRLFSDVLKEQYIKVFVFNTHVEATQVGSICMLKVQTFSDISKLIYNDRHKEGIQNRICLHIWSTWCYIQFCSVCFVQSCFCLYFVVFGLLQYRFKFYFLLCVSYISFLPTCNLFKTYERLMQCRFKSLFRRTSLSSFRVGSSPCNGIQYMWICKIITYQW